MALKFGVLNDDSTLMDFYFEQTNQMQAEQQFNSVDHQQSIAKPPEIDSETLLFFCE